MLQKKLDQANI